MSDISVNASFGQQGATRLLPLFNPKIRSVVLQALAYMAIFAVGLTLIHFGVTPLTWTMLGCFLTTLAATAVFNRKAAVVSRFDRLAQYLMSTQPDPKTLSKADRRFLANCATMPKEKLERLSQDRRLSTSARAFYSACLETKLQIFEMFRCWNWGAQEGSTDKANAFSKQKISKFPDVQEAREELTTDLDRSWNDEKSTLVIGDQVITKVNNDATVAKIQSLLDTFDDEVLAAGVDSHILASILVALGQRGRGDDYAGVGWKGAYGNSVLFNDGLFAADSEMRVLHSSCSTIRNDAGVLEKIEVVHEDTVPVRWIRRLEDPKGEIVGETYLRVVTTASRDAEGKWEIDIQGYESPRLTFNTYSDDRLFQPVFIRYPAWRPEE